MANPSANEDTLRRTNTLPLDERLTLSSVRSVYRRVAPIYDWAFNRVFEQGRRLAIKTLDAKPGERVLEVGVGTGLSLRHWPAHANITGIDICPEMLARAEKARTRLALDHVQLRVMDAQAMDFPDNSFDKIAAMYVVSVAPDLGALLREVQRVCVPGGRIGIVNHFERPNGIMRYIEHWMSHHASFFGWDAALPIERVTQRPGLKILNVTRVNFAGYWMLLEAENRK